MKDTLLKLSITMQNLMHGEEGQDLIEYALLVAIIALAATASLGSVATDINAAFTKVATTLSAYTS